MFSTLRTRFGIPGVISVIALVFAMFGGAYAASNSSGGGKATASAAKGKPGPRGKTGKTGPAGPQGPAGPAGPAGAKGDTGAAGSPGTSVKNEAEAKGANCKEGGTKLVGTSTTYACNGEKGAPGAPGAPGEPWTLGGTLPSEATETGAWYMRGEEKTSQTMPIGWSIPLSEADAASFDENDVHTVGLESSPGGPCTGSAQNPTAPPGNLCIYTSDGEGFMSRFGPGVTIQMGSLASPAYGVSSAGALIYTEEAAFTTSSWAEGSFAITAP